MTVEHVGKVAKLATDAEAKIALLIQDLNDSLGPYGVYVGDIQFDSHRFVYGRVDIILEEGRAP